MTEASVGCLRDSKHNNLTMDFGPSRPRLGATIVYCGEISNWPKSHTLGPDLVSNQAWGVEPFWIVDFF